MTLGDYCTAVRKDGELVITIPEERMLSYFQRDPDFPLVNDHDRFLRFLAETVLQVESPTGHDGFETALERLIKRAASKYEES